MGRRGVFALAATAAVALAILRTGDSAAQPPARAAAKWEYQVLAESAVAKAGGLNKVGDEGWELVAVEPKVPRLNGFNVNLPFLRVDKATGVGSGNGTASGFTFITEPGEKQFYFKRAR